MPQQGRKCVKPWLMTSCPNEAELPLHTPKGLKTPLPRRSAKRVPSVVRLRFGLRQPRLGQGFGSPTGYLAPSYPRAAVLVGAPFFAGKFCLPFAPVRIFATGVIRTIGVVQVLILVY